MNKKIDNSESDSLDLLYILHKLLSRRLFIIKSCLIAIVLGLIISYSIPKEYTTTVTLASEVTRTSSASSVAALANMAGLNIGTSNNRDALSPLIYPEVVSSTPFIIELFNIEVESLNGKIKTTLSEYILNNQKSPWWSPILSFPKLIISNIKSLFSKKSEVTTNDNTSINSFDLSWQELSVINSLKSRIKVYVDSKTAIITIMVTMQDPKISAMAAKTVTEKLQTYITDYRTNKAKVDLKFAEKLFNDSQETYYNAQEQYAEYMDKNQNISLNRVNTKKERLQSDMQLAYNIYIQSAQQLQLAKAKLQENTPIYATIQPASIPSHASKPSKIFIIAGLTVIAFIFSSVWVLLSDSILASFRRLTQIIDNEH